MTEFLTKTKEKTKVFLKNTLADKVRLGAIIIIVFGILLRIIRFGTIPNGLNQDEAFAGYEAYSLAKFGKDSFGNRFPVYFVSWGSGMNVLESYLAIPFVAIFGLTEYTIRLPQLIVGCFSVVVFYLVLKKVVGKNKYLLGGLLLFALSPWHIMASRWALESNVAPGFLLFGFFFFLKGVEKSKHYIFSAIFFGLSLYAYAVVWAVVPVMLGLMILYIIITRRKVQIKYAIISCAILTLLALPLLLFVAVNKGYIGEIKTSFITIPKMLVMRDEEVKFKNIFEPKSWYDLFTLLITYKDNLPWNSTHFNVFYHLLTPFALFGIVSCCLNFTKTIKKREYSPYALTMLAFAATFIGCLTLLDKNINRINAVHTFYALTASIGFIEVTKLFKGRQLLSYGLALCFTLSGTMFTSYYFSEYNKEISSSFRAGAGKAITYVRENDLQDVYVDSSIYFPQVLFYDRTNVNKYLKTVEFKYYPAKWLSAKSFTKYTFGINDSDIGVHLTYIIKTSDKGKYEGKGYAFYNAGNYTVVYKTDV